jgi:HK97 family phage major capsid protein
VVNKTPTYTKCTNATATDLFVANFRQLLIGQRLQITLRPLEELYAGTGQIGVVASWRGDVALARPSAFAVHRALKGAASA